ncbi:GNAT family N-acetyltransferase [Jidongwangia harbinensis]|uniref:GNAT family N-acetyltransferase n=1 Tax=Jidongwangia harbinensis TaxID=2878561 RepID=UPI001CD948CC|nr:GNAT family N-acetyltransferase [Jidongwangia harbinensis]MCA2212332.1 GNAT family N-acetyltransferase [Jidongwangia harbinensis]
MAHRETDVFDRLERFYDAVPRDAAVAEEIGGFVLFVREGEGWPFYARPRLGADTPSAADVTSVRRRQRELGIPEAFEWVHENSPDLLAVARSAGLDVLLAPLMVLERAALVPDLPLPGASIRLLDASSPTFAADLAASRAVGHVGFRTPAPSSAPLPGDATAGLIPTGPLSGAPPVAPAGPAERDAVPPPAPESLADQQKGYAAGRFVGGVVETPADGIVACGTVQRVGDVAEIVGVATLPSARGRGYASQLTANLARHALEQGVNLVFLSAGTDDVARLYSKVGFRRIGTACIAEPAAAPL